MSETLFNVFGKLDPKVLESFRNINELAFADGALPRKVKLLIAMALDAAHGAVNGVRALAQAAMQAGATKEEIAEALRVAYFINGVGSLFTAAHALKDIIK